MADLNVFGAAVLNQGANQQSIAVTTSDVELLPTRIGRTPRMMLVITPTTSGATLSLSLGDTPAAAATGIQLTAGQPFIQSANTVQEAIQSVWQGAVHSLASANTTVATMEQYYNPQ
jgi:hypothetical protein